MLAERAVSLHRAHRHSYLPRRHCATDAGSGSCYHPTVGPSCAKDFFLPAELVKIHSFHRTLFSKEHRTHPWVAIVKYFGFHHRNGVPMRGDGHHIHLSQDGSLTISNVQEADEGSYTCSAYSSSSSVSASSEVKVLRSQPSSEYSSAFLLLLAQCLAPGHYHTHCVPVQHQPWALGSSRSPAFHGQKSRMLETSLTRALGA